MNKNYLYANIDIAQSSKKSDICGDVIHTIRRKQGTLILLCDGIGSGIKANLAAKMLIARLTELIDRGFSQHIAFHKIVETQNQYRTNGFSYVAFTLIWIRPDGATEILSHDGTRPIVIPKAGRLHPVNMDYHSSGQAIIGQCNLQLNIGDRLLVFSDGITQAGLGRSCAAGWTENQIAKDIASQVEELNSSQIASAVHKIALQKWGKPDGDDCTVMTITLGKPETVTLLTGPPANKKDDPHTINDFLNLHGTKIICGGTTAGIAARIMNKELTVTDDVTGPWTPPCFALEGIDMVTEGVVTLNQIANLIKIDPSKLQGASTAEKLCRHLLAADQINFIVGQAQNPASNDTLFTQIGVTQRINVIETLKKELSRLDKLVLIDYI
ncbi:MAG: SpoIIE family protein phosphatase [Phycisphaerae bacterium]|nr:SpoIIE family protein phosphatase [Phycisphaerae bacterium]